MPGIVRAAEREWERQACAVTSEHCAAATHLPLQRRRVQSSPNFWRPVIHFDASGQFDLAAIDVSVQINLDDDIVLPGVKRRDRDLPVALEGIFLLLLPPWGCRCAFFGPQDHPVPGWQLQFCELL